MSQIKKRLIPSKSLSKNDLPSGKKRITSISVIRKKIHRDGSVTIISKEKLPIGSTFKDAMNTV